ncbi:MAG: hypothetical protein IKB86_03025 [Clostridia bacterium]|nr:hypothetical protein [Clostridia bacterium]
MKRIFFKFNLVGLLCLCAGVAFIIFNIPLYVWLIMLGALLVAVGIYMCR